MELDKPFGSDAPDRTAINDPAAAQVLPSVLHTKNIVAFVIKFIGMNVELLAASVPEHEIAFPSVVTSFLFVALRGKHLSQPRHLLVWNRDIEVQVGTGLMAKQGINGPPSVDINLKAVLLQELDEFDGVFGVHEKS